MTSTVFPDADVSTSPGFIARPPGMFSVVGTMPITLIGAFSSPIARMAQTTAAPPGHVVLHPLHAVGRLDRDAAGVEGDALADQPEHGRRAAPRRAVAHDDHARRLGAAARDTEQQAHAELRDLALVEDVDRDSGGSQIRRRARQNRRREHVRRLVAQFARDVRRFTKNAAAIDRGFELRRFRAGRGNQRLIERRRAAFAALVTVGAEGGQRDALGRGLHGFEQRKIAAVEPGKTLNPALRAR